MTQGARVLRPERSQLRWDMVSLDTQLPPDHHARVVWSFVTGLDLSVRPETLRVIRIGCWFPE